MKAKKFTLERTDKPLVDIKTYRRRQLYYFLFAFALIVISLLIGMIGFMFFTGKGWVDSFYNASMILTGMGPAEPLETNGAKIFMGCYSLFSGVVFLSTVAIMFTPMIHRFLHRMHLEE